MRTRIRRIEAWLTSEAEINEALDIVGQRTMILTRVERDGTHWLVGETVDSDRVVRVQLGYLDHTDRQGETTFVAEFGPTGSEAFAFGVLASLLRVSLGERLDKAVGYDCHLSNFSRYVEVARLLRIEGGNQPKYRIT